MVDTKKRKQLATTLRQFIAGQTTNRQFEKLTHQIICKPKRSDDQVLIEIEIAANELYDDFHKHKLRDEWAIPKNLRHIIARWILFLYTDLEYENQILTSELKITSLILVFFIVITLPITIVPLLIYFHFHSDDNSSDEYDICFSESDTWPFNTLEQLNQAKANPTLLTGGGLS